MKLTIGQFSQASDLTIKMLRHYDKIGLLMPVEKDFMTEYRYYDVNQIELAQKIIKYKKIGFSLNKIKEILAAQDEQYAIKLNLKEQLIKIEKEIESLISIKSQILTALNQKEGINIKEMEDIIMTKTNSFTAKMAEILDKVSDGVRMKIIDEIYNNGTITKQTAGDIGENLCNQLIKEHRLATISDILNLSSRETEKNIVQNLEKNNPELAEEIKNSLFVFDDIALLDDKSIQMWLREIEVDDLIIALKGANKETIGRIKSNMSERAVKILEENMDKLRPVKLKLLEQTQFKLIGIIKKLEQTGNIFIKRKKEI